MGLGGHHELILESGREIGLRLMLESCEEVDLQFLAAIWSGSLVRSCRLSGCWTCADDDVFAASKVCGELDIVQRIVRDSKDKLVKVML